ncbi:M20 family metallopeptidase [Gephyromycinifex aptenodytis]|uniref:M20 family metallopeptidase n=1 Tax=Gephyromycinifex aptenodytis TaxID=2716227 RepID=UPI001446E780|nr:M20 family metallopeptidase [Gephyromycinifex aptenodytis]
MPEHPLFADLDQAVARVRPAVTTLLHEIHAYAEPAFAEHRSAAACRVVLSDNGFDVTGVEGLPTAFVARRGAGALRVAVCLEYDALPIGHACGHNLIAAVGAITAVALGEVADRAGLQVTAVGCPAEESGGGKALLLEAGVFDGIDLAVMAHPGDHDSAWFDSWALSTLEVVFDGEASHAVREAHVASQPRDALVLAETALGLMRGHLPPDCAVVAAPTGDLGTPGAVPSHTRLALEVRAPDAELLRAVRERVERACTGVAAAASCTATITAVDPDYLDFRTDPELARLYADTARDLGRDVGPGRGRFAMTDMGNVSHAVRAIHPMFDITGGACAPHEPEFADHARSPRAQDAAVTIATALARTVLLVGNPVG